MLIHSVRGGHDRYLLRNASERECAERAGAAASQRKHVSRPSVIPPTGISPLSAASTSNPVATPGVNSPSSTSLPSAAQTYNPIDNAKVEVGRKTPTNATKPEYIKLMQKKNGS